MAHAVEKPNYSDLDELEDDANEITDKFAKAAEHLKTLASGIDDNTLLLLYGYYKQATEGPCNISKPPWYNTKGKAKWDAWNKLARMPQGEAQLRYVQLVESIDPDFLQAPKEGWVTISTMQANEKALSESEKSLIDYVKEGNCGRVLDILKRYKQEEVGGVVNKLDEDGLGLIHWAADRGSSEVLSAVISFGADVNLVDADMQTALHYAASCGHLDCVEVLLKSQADVSLKDADGLDAKAVANDPTIRELLSSFA